MSAILNIRRLRWTVDAVRSSEVSRSVHAGRGTKNVSIMGNGQRLKLNGNALAEAAALGFVSSEGTSFEEQSDGTVTKTVVWEVTPAGIFWLDWLSMNVLLQGEGHEAQVAKTVA